MKCNISSTERGLKVVKLVKEKPSQTPNNLIIYLIEFEFVLNIFSLGKHMPENNVTNAQGQGVNIERN